MGEAAHTGVPVQGLPPPLPNQLPANVPQEAAVAQILGSLLNCPITARAGPGQTQRRELDPNLPIWVTGTQLLGGLQRCTRAGSWNWKWSQDSNQCIALWDKGLVWRYRERLLITGPNTGMFKQTEELLAILENKVHK